MRSFNPDPITGAPGSHPVGTGTGAARGAMIAVAVGSLAYAGSTGRIAGPAGTPHVPHPAA